MFRSVISAHKGLAPSRKNTPRFLLLNQRYLYIRGFIVTSSVTPNFSETSMQIMTLEIFFVFLDVQCFSLLDV